MKNTALFMAYFIASSSLLHAQEQDFLSQAVEKYAAQEVNDTPQKILSEDSKPPVSIEQNTSTQIDSKPKNEEGILLLPEAQTSTPKNTQEKTNKQHNYDWVSPEHRGFIKERLKLVYEIITKTGKAFDYRSKTTAELKKILEITK